MYLQALFVFFTDRNSRFPYNWRQGDKVPSILSVFYIADPDLHQDPAFPRFCLSKWSIQELFPDFPTLFSLRDRRKKGRGRGEG